MGERADRLRSPPKTKRYLILGAGGCFGINTALYLLDHAYPEAVIGIGRNPLGPEPFSLGIESRKGYTYHQLHITQSFDNLLAALDSYEPHVVINFAAQADVSGSFGQPGLYYETNLTTPVRLVQELQKRDYLERFIQIGTSELYGSVNAPAKEDTPLRPSTPYAVSKAAFDLHLESLWKVQGFRMNILRPSNAYCPGQLPYRIIPKAVVCGLTGTKLPLQGGGRAEKTYIHARDMARAIHLVAEKSEPGKVYNVGAKSATSIRTVVSMVAERMSLSIEDLCEEVPDRLGQDSRYWLDSSAIERDLGWSPHIGWDEGLDEMIAWGRRYIDVLKDWPQSYAITP